ncbi:regulatory protein [Streptomyces laurentii]|uniref:Regulatory protein n=1 Tax=Streptomyces laurentii TaxID=39478 RepID=A0A160P2Y7_STRLU|nr:regulatory protein [Streptomyces laurentii]
MNEEPTQLLASVRQFGIQLSATPRGARLARLLAVEQLRTWELDAVADAAAQIVAELANNAATHGHVSGRDFQLAMFALPDVLRIEVTDTRAERLPVVCPHGDGESGRGLVLVDALASRGWGVELGPPPRKTVWAQVELAPPGRALS